MASRMAGRLPRRHGGAAGLRSLVGRGGVLNSSHVPPQPISHPPPPTRAQTPGAVRALEGIAPFSPTTTSISGQASSSGSSSTASAFTLLGRRRIPQEQHAGEPLCSVCAHRNQQQARTHTTTRLGRDRTWAQSMAALVPPFQPMMGPAPTVLGPQQLTSSASSAMGRMEVGAALAGDIHHCPVCEEMRFHQDLISSPTGARGGSQSLHHHHHHHQNRPQAPLLPVRGLGLQQSHSLHTVAGLSNQSNHSNNSTKSGNTHTHATTDSQLSGRIRGDTPTPAIAIVGRSCGCSGGGGSGGSLSLSLSTSSRRGYASTATLDGGVGVWENRVSAQSGGVCMCVCVCVVRCACACACVSVWEFGCWRERSRVITLSISL